MGGEDGTSRDARVTQKRDGCETPRRADDARVRETSDDEGGHRRLDGAKVTQRSEKRRREG